MEETKSKIVWIRIGYVANVFVHGSEPKCSEMTPVKKITALGDGTVLEFPARTFDHRPERMKKEEDPLDRQVSFIFDSTIHAVNQSLGVPKLTPENSLANVHFVMFPSVYNGGVIRNTKGRLEEAKLLKETKFDIDQELAEAKLVELLGEPAIKYIKYQDRPGVQKFTEPRVPCNIMNKKLGDKCTKEAMMTKAGGFLRTLLFHNVVIEKRKHFYLGLEY